ncbi:MAG: hydroxyisourate hydrolase [Phormidesmis sp.]
MNTVPTGKLTTHVLDTAAGRPAAGMTIELWQIEVLPIEVLPIEALPITEPATQQTTIQQTAAQHMATQVTNADGRTDSPFLRADSMVAGIYELRFSAGDYFAKNFVGTEVALPNPPFLDWVPIRFGMADPHAHYHVPLLVSPWSYSTYRGS